MSLRWLHGAVDFSGNEIRSTLVNQRNRMLFQPYILKATSLAFLIQVDLVDRAHTYHPLQFAMRPTPSNFDLHSINHKQH